MLRSKHSGVSRLTIAAPAGPKMELAKSLDAGDYYVPLDRSNAIPQWEQIKKDNPYGFDIGMGRILHEWIFSARC